ncbi:MAG: ABC transporter substrate-binding protein, partial [Chloroflexota bacterium]
MTFRRLPILILLALLLVSVAPLAAQDISECEDSFRLFEHFAGETCIPENPQRIASLSDNFLTTPLLDVEAPVVASIFRTWEGGEPFLSGGADGFEGAENLVNLGNPVDLEIILEVNPDLIIGGFWNAEIYDELSAIAPTVLFNAPVPMFEHMERLADASNRLGVYNEKLADYEVRIEEMRALINDPASITISRMDINADGLWYSSGLGALDQVIDDIGFSRPEFQANTEGDVRGLSIEEMPLFDGDIILSSYAPRFGQTIENLQTG